MRFEPLKKEIEALTPGTHIACIYRNKSEQGSIVIPFLLCGLENNEKCIYIADENTDQEIIDAFKEVLLNEYMNTTQLEVLKRESLKNLFDPDNIRELLISLEKKALQKGYSGLRIVWEMTWILTGLPKERFIYEASLTDFFPTSNCIALCQYNEKTFGPEILFNVLHTYPALIIYDSLYENPCYLPPDEFFAAMKGEVCWNTYEKAKNAIIDRKKTEEKMRIYQRERDILLNSMSESVVLYDADKKIQWVNTAGIDLIGAPREAVTGEYCYTVWHKRDTPCEHCPIHKAWERAVYQEGDVILPDQRMWRIKASPVFHRGTCTGFVVVSKDITEQKRAEKKFRDLFDYANDAIFIHDLKNHFLDVNKTALTRLGYTKKEFLQLTPADVNPPQSAVVAPERLKELQQKGCLFFETVHITKKGKKIPVEVNSRLIEYQGKKAVLSAARDITKRKEAEKALKESELRYRTLFESAPLGIGLTTVDGQILTYNNVICQMTGYTREELERVHVTDMYVNPQERAALLECIQKNGFVSDFEVHLKRKDNTTYWASLNTVLFPLGGEQVFLTIIQDISDYKRAEKLLKKSEEKYRELVENVNEIVYTVDDTGVITYVSPPVHSFMDYTPAEIVGHHFSEYVYHKDLPRLKESFQQLLSGNTTADEYRTVGKSGEIRWMRSSTRPIVTKGKIIGVQGILTDITEQKRVEETLRYQLDFEELITTISTDFINLNPDEIDKGIDQALKTIGEFTGVDRSYVYIFSDDGTTMDNTHEWCAEGIESNKSRLQGFKTSNFSWGMKKLKNFDVLNIPSVTALFDSVHDKPVFPVGEIKSLLCIPMVVRGTLIGVVGLDAIRTERAWSDEAVSMLTMVAEVFATALERNRSEEVLWEREEQYRTTIDSMGDAIHVVDDTLRIILVNKAFKKWCKELGLTTDIVGKTPFEVFPFLPDSVRGEYYQVLNTGEPLITEERTKIKGNDFVTKTRKIPVLKEGKVCRVITVVRDITERKKAEEQIKASLKEKEVLLREVHHRVKNNMQVISSLLNLQAEYSEDDTYANLLKESQHRIRTMALIHEKLYQSENVAEIDFEGYITGLVYRLLQSYGATARGVTPRVEVEDISLGIDVAIPCGLIINELVSNSLKYAFPHGKGEITVKIRSINGKIELTVKDNGVGMPDIDIRAAKTLGLDLVMTLAEEQLEGEITVDKTKGTTFIITFEP